MTRISTVFLLLGLAGCVAVQEPVAPLPDDVLRPAARPGTMARPAPPEGARTAEEFDTTTDRERMDASAAPEPASERRLGETVVSLGDVSRTGFWLETPLVDRERPGRVVDPETGAGARVSLIPSDGGSRLSLAAMRLMDLPLTGLPVVAVFTAARDG